MLTKTEQLDLLYAMAENERAVAGLYQVFSQKNPERKDFWMGFVNEELGHAGWLVDIYDKVVEGKVEVSARDFSADDVIQSVKDIQKQTDEVLNSDLEEFPHEKQLEIAIKNENGLLEKKFFEVFSSDDPELKKVFDDLEEETAKHRKRLSAELESE